MIKKTSTESRGIDKYGLPRTNSSLNFDTTKYESKIGEVYTILYDSFKHSIDTGNDS